MNEDEWRKNEWRCNHGWLRGEQCEICNAPKREWVGLTDEERAEITKLKWWDWEDSFDVEGFIRAIEAALKDKNT